MAGYSQAPTGLARRPRRLSDAETEQRLLRAAVAMARDTGLTVSLEHISFEDLIRDAGVSRSAAYRRWPHKDLFFSDLVKALAEDVVPSIVVDELELMRRVIADYQDWLSTPALRHGLVVELIRQLSLLDFQTLYRSPAWRTYLALHATFMSIPGGQLRDQVREAIARSEERHLTRVATAWEQLTALFGYRLRPDLGVTFQTLATVLDATMRGLVMTASSTPDITGDRVQARPFGAASEQEWSLPALGLASVATGFLEPDPEITWDDDRLTAVREALAAWSPPDV
jgi:AcrR family transcriptional regulator